MNRIEKKALKNPDILKAIYDSLEPKELLDLLIQQDMLDESEREIMLAEITRRGRVDKFLQAIKTKNKGFESLLIILKDGNMCWVGESLEEEYFRLLKEGEVDDLMKMLNKEKISVRLSQRQCLELGKMMGLKWKEVAFHLDFEQGEIYAIEQEHRDSPTMQACTLLIKWGQRKVNGANFAELHPILEMIGIAHDETKIVNMFS